MGTTTIPSSSSYTYTYTYMGRYIEYLKAKQNNNNSPSTDLQQLINFNFWPTTIHSTSKPQQLLLLTTCCSALPCFALGADNNLTKQQPSSSSSSSSKCYQLNEQHVLWTFIVYDVFGRNFFFSSPLWVVHSVLCFTCWLFLPFVFNFSWSSCWLNRKPTTMIGGNVMWGYFGGSECTLRFTWSMYGINRHIYVHVANSLLERYILKLSLKIK